MSKALIIAAVDLRDPAFSAPLLGFVAIWSLVDDRFLLALRSLFAVSPERNALIVDRPRSTPRRRGKSVKRSLRIHRCGMAAAAIARRTLPCGSSAAERPVVDRQAAVQFRPQGPRSNQ
jgi:hypothetical protein